MEMLLQNETVMLVLAAVIALNVFLTGLYQALDLIKDKTKWDGDNKLHAVLQKVLYYLQKVIEFAQGNPKHK